MSIFFVKNISPLLFILGISKIFSYNSFDKTIIQEREFSSFKSFIPKEDNIIYNFGNEIPINSLKFLKYALFFVLLEKTISSVISNELQN